MSRDMDVIEKKEKRRMSTNMVTALITRKSNQKKLAKNLVIMAPNGIIEERFVKIGGIDQWITIRGEDRRNPVLFFVHGGPGSVYSIFAPLLRSWERFFTLVQWDQRGAGKTLRKNGKEGTGPLTFERLVQDGIEITEFLRTHLGQPIILVGSSTGSITGTIMAKRRPELFAAYVGADQNSTPDASEMSYRITREWLQAKGKTKDIATLDQLNAKKGHLTTKEFTQRQQLTIKAALPIKSDSSASCTVWRTMHSTGPN